MSATEELKHEHRVIERILAILEAATVRVDMGQELPTEFFPKVVDFPRMGGESTALECDKIAFCSVGVTKA